MSRLNEKNECQRKKPWLRNEFCFLLPLGVNALWIGVRVSGLNADMQSFKTNIDVQFHFRLCLSLYLVTVHTLV